MTNIRDQASRISTKVNKLLKQTEQLRADGALSEGRVLDHSNKILNLLRECNVALRWVMLHAASLSRGGADSNRRCKAVRDQVRKDSSMKNYWLTKINYFNNYHLNCDYVLCF